jgi:hypothetical protein
MVVVGVLWEELVAEILEGVEAYEDELARVEKAREEAKAAKASPREQRALSRRWVEVRKAFDQFVRGIPVAGNA